MSQVASEIIFIIILIIANGVFAMSEIAVVSARKARLQQRVNEGDVGAKAALELAEAPGSFLATVQIGITLVGILAGAFGGATIAEEIARYLETIPALAPYAEPIGLLLVVVVITYFSLVIGELVPKQIGLRAPERIASLIARPMHILALIVSPLVSILNLSTKGVLAVLRVKQSSEPKVTEEEIKVLITQGAELGIFEQSEQEMVERVFRLGDLQIGSLIVPRTEIVWFDITDTPDSVRQKIAADPYSRYPVGKGSLDRVVGMVAATDLLIHSLGEEPFDIQRVLQKPLFVPQTTAALKVLQLLRDTGSHTALVIDEYGGLLGLVSINSILEEIITDASLSFTTEPMAVKREDGSWLLDGLLPIDELATLLDIPPLAEDAENYKTLGGFSMKQMGQIPRTGDHFAFGNWKFEILDMDGLRVDKVLISAIEHVTTDEDKLGNG